MPFWLKPIEKKEVTREVIWSSERVAFEDTAAAWIAARIAGAVKKFQARSRGEQDAVNYEKVVAVGAAAAGVSKEEFVARVLGARQEKGLIAFGYMPPGSRIAELLEQQAADSQPSSEANARTAPPLDKPLPANTSEAETH